jgi:hypothetical protein
MVARALESLPALPVIPQLRGDLCLGLYDPSIREIRALNWILRIRSGFLLYDSHISQIDLSDTCLHETGR